MATATAFGSITIIDVTDIGEFSVYPMSNLPLSVLYSPDENTYTPSWTTNNLILTPVVYYAGKALTLGTAGLNITWQKMEGISTVTMNAHEITGSTGILTVNSNQFNENSSIITYTVTATYLEPTSQTTLTAQGQISFSLVKMASEARNVTVNGNNIFKYNASGSCDITSTTLNAVVTDNLTITDWEYSNNDGTSWTSLSNATSSLTISEGSTIFSNDRVLIRVVAQDKRDATAYYYDYITVLKLRDGTAAGNSLVLSNESQQIPCGSDGTPTASAFKLANTSIYIYESGSEVTSEYTITATPNGVLGAWSNSSTQAPTGNATASQKGSYKYYWVTGWASSNTSEVGEVVFTAVKGTETLTKKMSLIKIKTGADGVSPTVYSLDLSDLIVNKSYSYSATPDSNGNYSVTGTSYAPTSIVATISQTTGNTTSAFNGYVKVFKDGGTTAIASGTATGGKYTLSGIGSTHVPTSYLTFELYSGSGASDKLLDSQNVIVTSDGVKGNRGEQGISGQSAINLVLGNYSDTIPVSTGYKPTSATTLTIPFAVYEGTTMIPSSITAANAAITFNSTTITPTVVNSTASAYGTLTYSIATSQVIGASSVTNGSKSLSFSYTASGNKTGSVTGTYSWALTIAPTNGYSYQMTLSSDIMKRVEKGSSSYQYIPSTITATSQYSSGSGIASNRTCYWKVESTTDYSTWTTLFTHTSSTTATINPDFSALTSDVVALRFTAYSNTALTSIYSQKTINIINESNDGASTTITSSTDYQQGDSGTTVPTGTWSSTIPSVSSGKYLWTRTTNVYTTIDKYGNSSNSTKYNYSVSYKASNGTNSVILQVFTPSGYIFQNGDGTLDITAQLMNGANVQTSSVTYQWAKYTSGNYVDISGATSATLTVSGSEVDGYASYRCAATYSGKTYYGYASLMDKTDPLQVAVLSTVGTQILNGNGVGAFYAIVTRNGEEIDALKSNTFVTSKPATLTNGKLYYFIDSSTKTVKLMKATSTSAWSEQTATYTGTYTWSYRNANNEAVTTGTPATSGKVVYIDADLVNKKIIIDVEVEI